MKYLEFLLTLILIIGIFLLMSGIAGSHGRFTFHADRLEDWLIILMPLIGLMGLVLLMMKRTRLESSEFKAEIQDKEEFKDLLTKLDEAMLLANNKGVGKTSFFPQQLAGSIDNLKNLELAEVDNLWTWFAPRGEWDNFTGAEGADLGNDIFMLTEKIKSYL
jgi:hypothetical protein